MAKKKVARAKNKKSQSSFGMGWQFLILLLFLPVFLLSMPSVVFLLFAMLPSIVALIAGNSTTPFRNLCLGAMNLAGALPFLFHLWMNNHSFEGAVDILFNLSTLLVIYGTASLGLLLYHLLPIVVGLVIEIFLNAKIRRLQIEQEDLLETWGASVVSVANKVLKKKQAS
ncbi:MAG: hypothetical protein IKD08_05130 [Alphaproteobacteria bacterium]|nr:hypothetical protein [Alphaproteobacteria bacterium]